MKSSTLRRTVVAPVALTIVAIGLPVHADSGPPFKISMPSDTPQARSGVEYEGVFTVDVREAGTLSDFEIHGTGWAILDVEVASDSVWAKQGEFRIPFRAIPTDADQRISLTLRYDGRRVTRSLRIGPAAFAQRGKDRAAIRVESVPQKKTPPSPPPPKSQRRTDASDAPEEPRGDLTLRFEGRIVYDRPTGMSDGCEGPTGFTEEGVDYIWVEVMDEDDDWDDTIWSGRTQPDGTFDTGWFTWGDGGESPDIYLRFECDTGIVNVQDGDDPLEADWSWSNIDNYIPDWDGDHHDFGTLKPGNSAHMPALHIFNSITRGHRFLYDRGITDLPEVDVLWPSGDNASYSSYYEEIYISPLRQWDDGTHLHEYGHHFTYHEAAHIEVDYCNGWCDGEDCSMCGGAGCPGADPDDCPNPGHCAGCPENLHDAWHEGFPNWMSDLIGRSWADDYTLSDGSEWVVLGACDKNEESLRVCCQDGLMHDGTDALITERFVGALLRDMEDETQDEHDNDGDGNVDFDGIMDSLCLGFDEIFHITMHPSQPQDVEQFMTLFRALYPEHEEAFWRTAYNVSPAYTDAALYPDDTLDPAAVTWAQSPTHPWAEGGTRPCITVEWEPPDDDVTGACAYSLFWSHNPDGVDPGTDPSNLVDFSGCLPSYTFDLADLGDWYVSIRAQDCAGHWSPDWGTFGPFSVIECNDNGILDVCEVACDASGLDLTPECANGIPAYWCTQMQGCGTAQDCNGNIIPDDCDIASGFSADCNFDGIPDECQNMVRWIAGSGAWGMGTNWDSGAPPAPGQLACINVPEDVTVSHTLDAATVGELSCHENLNIFGNVAPWIDFTITEPSFILGNLTFGGLNATLAVDAPLDVDGLFSWVGGGSGGSAKLSGAGVTHANGGVLISDVVHLDGHHLVLDGYSTSVSTTGRVDTVGTNSVFEIRPFSTYEHQGSGYILNGWLTDQFINQGTLIKSVDSGSSTISMFTNSAGLIHVQAGTLKFYLGSSSTGDFLADPGAMLEFNGGNHDFLPGSSIVADNVLFSSGAAGPNNVRGTYDVNTMTTLNGESLTFTNEANIISYGSSFNIPKGTVNFDTSIGGTIQFDTLSLGSYYAGTANFNSGDPVQVTNLIIGPGTINGPSTITIDGLLTWNGGGHFHGPGTVNADGDVLVNLAGNQKTITGCVFNNSATATLLGWFSMSSSAVLNNLVTGVLDIQVDGGVIQALQTAINNAGMLVKSAGVGTSTISAEVTNTGTVEIQAGELEFYTHYSGYYVQTAGQTILNGGDLAMFGPAPVQIDGGSLTGSGTITGNVVNTGGSTEPGNGTGATNIVGTYTQEAGATLAIELGGLVQGITFDALFVTGNASLDGILTIGFVNAFIPSGGEVFEVLTAAAVAGTFDQAVVSNLPSGLTLDVVYNAASVELTIVPTVPGDCTLDEQVTLDDYACFWDCISGPSGGLTMPICGTFDQDADQDVDLEDMAAFTSLFGG